MKWMIASDLHGSALYCEQMLDAFRREKADRLVLLGDLLYHGPRNPLPEGYDPRRCAELLTTVRDQVLCVRGNCDSAVDQMVLPFPITAEYALLDLGSRLVYVTHGDAWNEEHPPLLPRGSVLLTGHTHVSACHANGDFVYMNPGSPSLPHDEGHRGYILLTADGASFRELDGSEYRSYTF